MPEATKSQPLESASFIVSPAQLALDAEMLAYDVWGTQAHVVMLAQRGIIPPAAATRICEALGHVAEKAITGEFQIDPNRGAQLSLEAAVIAELGVSDGSRMHTARSRNDQVMVTEMLYLRDGALLLAETTLDVISTLLALSGEHIETVMPGYTHMQPAKPTTLGQWALSYANAMLRNMDALRYTWDEYDACPLGAVESYGTSWGIDRPTTAHLLGFSRVWEVPQDAIASRGLPQLAYLDVCKRIALTVSKLAADLLLFTTWEYGYMRLGEAVAQRLHPITGSSIMPQKRNPDVLELLRATASEIPGIAAAASHLLMGLPMGYNRDTRDMKEWSGLGFDKTLSLLSALRSTLGSLWVDKERMLSAVRANYSSTTDLADTVAQVTGTGYRQVYAFVGKLVDGLMESGRPLSSLTAADIVEAAGDAGISIELSDEQVRAALDPQRAVALRTHTGGAAKEEMARMLESRDAVLERHATWLRERKESIGSARKRTQSAIDALAE